MIQKLENGRYLSRIITYDKIAVIDQNGYAVSEVFPRDVMVSPAHHTDGSEIPLAIMVAHSEPHLLAVSTPEYPIIMTERDDGIWIEFGLGKSPINDHYKMMIDTGQLVQTSIGAMRGELDETLVADNLVRRVWRRVELSSVSLLAVPFHVN